MKKIISILLILSISLALTAQNTYKVLESSSKKAPKWIYGVEKDYLNVSATGESIEEAKDEILANIKRQITQSIATRVVSESNVKTNVNQSSSGDFSKNTSLENSIMSKTAKLPFIGEISLSKASDYYWEKRQDKKTKKIEYFYAVKYPFSEFEMKKLLLDYELHDKSLTEKLETFEAEGEEFSTVEEIGSKIVSVTAFLEEFIPEDPRYARCEALIKRYNNCYSSIVLDCQQTKKGTIVATLLLSGNVITTSQKPSIKSKCADNISYKIDGPSYIISFNSDNCYEDDENLIEIKFKAGNKYIINKVPIKTTVDISLTGIVIDKNTSEPIPYAKLTLIPGNKSVVTNRGGIYAFNDIKDGTYTIQCYKKGYSTFIANSVRVTSSGYSSLDIVMTPKNDVKANDTEDGKVQQDNRVEEPAAAIKDPIETVRNGLSAYFRFNNTTKSELSFIQGTPINAPMYDTDSQDGTKSICFSSLDESQLSFPKAMIAQPMSSYSISFWIKGISDGHLFSCTNGNDTWRSNIPLLHIKDGKFALLESSDVNFNHPKLDYKWHHIVLVINRNNNNRTATLFIDGVAVDNVGLGGSNDSSVTKFILCGKANYKEINAIDTKIDNLRIYGSRALSDEEVYEIYEAEK
ncbi:MAG: carboxypeptidase regulatory-like domain-containing protein [Acetatifactor sp.]